MKVICFKTKNLELFPLEDLEILQFPDRRIKRKLDKILCKLDLRLNRYSRLFAGQLSALIKSFGPDVVHCHFGIQALYLLDNIGDLEIPVFITFHGYDASLKLQESWVYRKRLYNLFQKNHIYPIFVCKAIVNNLHSFGITTTNGKVIYLGVDTDFFKRTNGFPNQGVTFLQVSSFVEKKGHEVTISAFAKFVERFPQLNANLVLVGDGPLRQKIQSRVVDFGLMDKVEIRGHLPPIEIRNTLEKANVFLHHSITSSKGDQEGIPTSIKEAMAMELPVVSTYHSGIPELVNNDLNGFLVREGDIETYIDKMRKALDIGRLGINRDKIMAEFEAKTQDEKLCKFFRLTI